MVWLARFLLEWVLIASAMGAAAYVHHPLGWLLAAAIVGTRQHALAVLGHDAAHGHTGGHYSPALACACFWPLGWGLSAFKRQHWRHHRATGSATDPEMPLRRQNIRAKRFGRWLPLVDLCGYSVTQAVAWFIVVRPARPLDAIGPAALAAAFLVLSPWSLVALWYASFLVFGTVTRQRAYTEHLGTATFRMSQPALWRRAVYLPHGTWLHWEHHRWPALPVAELRRRSL